MGRADRAIVSRHGKRIADHGVVETTRPTEKLGQVRVNDGWRWLSRLTFSEFRRGEHEIASILVQDISIFKTGAAEPPEPSEAGRENSESSIIYARGLKARC